MKIYKITKSTDLYHARRHVEFNGKNDITFGYYSTLKEATKELIKEYNKLNNTYYSNFNCIVHNTRKNSVDYAWINGENKGFNYDVFKYQTEAVNMDSLDELSDFINSNDDYPLIVDDVINANNWITLKPDHVICADLNSHEKLIINDEGKAERFELTPYDLLPF